MCHRGFLQDLTRDQQVTCIVTGSSISGRGKNGSRVEVATVNKMGWGVSKRRTESLKSLDAIKQAEEDPLSLWQLLLRLVVGRALRQGDGSSGSESNRWPE